MPTTTTNPAQAFADSHAEILREAQREVIFGLDPDGVIAAAAYVQREFGICGYTITPICGDRSGALWSLHHGDGSERRIWVDRWANVGLVSEAAR